MMNTLQIEEILRKHQITRSCFIGCFAADEISSDKFLNKMIKYPFSFIVNTDVASMPGEHWVAFYIRSPNIVEYFDSLAGIPNNHMGQFLGKFNKIIKNEYNLQNPFTNVCGQFCIYFIIKRCSGQHFKHIIKFLYKMKNPDKYVHNFVNMLLSK